MKISHVWLQSFFSKKLPAPDNMAELLTLHSFEVEGIEKVKGDYILDIDVLPNRKHDCLSHMGVAKEIEVLLKFKTNLKFKEINSKDDLKVKIKEPKLCSRYMGTAVNKVSVKSSPKWLKDQLEVLGQRAINNIVDATNYIMLETGQPLHAFDSDKIEGGIVVRHAKKGESITTLDNEKIDLNTDILVIADEKAPLAIAGIKGGRKAEITNKTRNIIIEAANFDAVNIRKSSRAVNITTDSSVRFVAGLDPNLAQFSMESAITLITEIAGGETLARTDIYPIKTKPIFIPFDLDRANSLLGVPISKKEAQDVLERLGCKIKSKGNKFLVTPPSVRLDLTIQEDLVEEIGRIYGYDKIDPRPAFVDMSVPPMNEFITARACVKDTLKGLGFYEAYNYSFVGEPEISSFGIRGFQNSFEIANPIRPEFAYLRPSLIFGLTKNIKDNAKHQKNLKLFEIGKIFNKKEDESIGLVVSSESDFKSSKEAFFALKGSVVSLFESFGVTDIWFDNVPDSAQEYEGHDNLLHPFQKSQIKVGDEEIGIIGALHPDSARSQKIIPSTAVAELDFNKFVTTIIEENEYLPLSKYPALGRDLALFVPWNTRVIDVMNILENSGGAILADADLFDVYEGKSDGERKSFAFHLVFQSYEKTLSDKEVDGTMERIIKVLEKNPNWEVRK